MTVQLELGFQELEARLRALGLPAEVPVALHTNTRVLVTRTPRGVLRLHRGYGHAPDEVLRAIVEWARPRVRRAARLAAQRTLTSFPVHSHVPRRPERRRPDAIRPGDARLVQRLHELHAELNGVHFAGALGRVKIGLSYLMRRKLGEFRPAAGPSGLASIVLGRRHLRRDGWTAAAETFLHEMIHQWQSETGLPLAHDRAFRTKAAAVGIDGRAVRRPDYLCGEGARELGDRGASELEED